MGGGSSTCRAGSLRGVSVPRGGSERRLQARERWSEAMAGIRSGELPSVDLTNQGLDPKAIEELCEALAGNEVVRSIELDGNKVGGEGAGHLGKVLAANSAIRFLDLAQNGIRDPGARALAAGLEANSALYHLDLTGNRISGAGADFLGKMLRTNGTMRQLTLSENKLGHEAMRSMGLAVKAHPSLRILSLRRCGLGAEGGRLLAEGLDHGNATLTELSVGLNNIQNSGAKAFAKVIMANGPLRELYMDGNSITDPGGIALAESLMHNDVLQTLWMVQNDLNVETVAKFADAVSQNSSLRRLGITSKQRVPTHVGEKWKAVHSKRHAEDRDGKGQQAALPQLPPREVIKESPAVPKGGGGQGIPTSEGASCAKEDGGPDDDDDMFPDGADGIDEFEEGALGYRPKTSRAQKEGVTRNREANENRMVQEIMLMDDQLEFSLHREDVNRTIRRLRSVDLASPRLGGS